MNRLIVKYASPLTVVVLAVFAWVVYRKVSLGWSEVIPLAVAGITVWVIGVPTFIYLWPRITVTGFKRAITKHGFSGGPIPVNTLYAEPSLSSASTGSLLATGTDEVLYVAGWLDVGRQPQILHVPDTAGRYYSVQLTDPSTGANFAYVGKRTTGTRAADYLLRGPQWTGALPPGMTQIVAPHDCALIIGRVFVASEEDQPTAYALAKQIQLSSLNA